MCLIEIYLVKLSIGLGHDVLEILLAAAVFLGKLIHSGNSSKLMKNYFRSLVHYKKELYYQSVDFQRSDDEMYKTIP